MNRREFLHLTVASGIGMVSTGGLSFESLAIKDERINKNPPNLWHQLPYSDDISLQNAFGAFPIENPSSINAEYLNYLGRAVLKNSDVPALSDMFLTLDNQVITFEIGTRNLYQFSAMQKLQPSADIPLNDPQYWNTYNWVSNGLKAVNELGIPLAPYIPPHTPVSLYKSFSERNFIKNPETFIDKFVRKKEFSNFYMLTEEGFIIDLAHAIMYAERFRIAKEDLLSKRQVKLATTTPTAPLVFDIDYKNICEANIDKITLAILMHHAYLSEYIQEAGNLAWAGIPQMLGKLGSLSNEDMHSNFIGISMIIECMEQGIEPTEENLAVLIGQRYKYNKQIHPHHIPTKSSAGIYPHLPVILFEDQKPLDIESIHKATSAWNEILLLATDKIKVSETNPYRAIFNRALGI